MGRQEGRKEGRRGPLPPSSPPLSGLSCKWKEGASATVLSEGEREVFGRGKGGGKGPLFHPPLVCTPVGWSVERRKEGRDGRGGWNRECVACTA